MIDPRQLEIQLHHGLEGLAQLASDWDDLASRMRVSRFRHSHAWQSSCLEALEGKPAMMSYAVVRERGEAKLILPLRSVPRKVMGFKTAIHQLLAHPEIPFCDFVAADAWSGDDLLMVLHELQRRHGFRCDVLRLPRIPENSLAAHALRTWPGGCVIHHEAATKADFITLKPYEELLAGLSKNFRSNLRKARNKLEATSGITFQTARAPSELPGAFEEFLRVEASGWKGSQGSDTAVASTPPMRKMLTLLIERLGPHGAVEINLLCKDGAAMAGQFAIVWGDEYSQLKIGYDQQYAALAPGNLLLVHVLQRFQCDERIKRVHLISDTEWHKDWNCEQETILHAHVFNSTLAGRRALLGMRLERVFGKHGG